MILEKHTSIQKSLSFAAVVAALAAGAMPAHAADAPATEPAVPKSASEAALIKYTESMKTFHTPITPFSKLRDAAFREEIKPKLVAAFAQMQKDYVEFQKDPTAMPIFAQYPFIQEYAVLLAVGDAETVAKVKTQAESKDPTDVMVARSEQALAGYLVAADDTAAIAALDQVGEILKATPKKSRDTIDGTFVFLAIKNLTLKGGDDKVKEKGKDLLAAYGNSAVVPPVDPKKKQAETFASILNKPMTLDGFTPDGKPFSSDQWKGKVILVDFWATWCAPCMAEVPHVMDVYTKYHDQGLEVLGVSSDYAKGALTKYVAKHSLPWPNLYNPEDDGTTNPLVLKYNIAAIPVMFLIDRNGVLRSVEGRGEMDTLVPQLLAEKPATK